MAAQSFGPELPSPNDHRAVPYPIVRDRFLSRIDEATGATAAELYVEVGRFVVDRWTAEEHQRIPSQPLDEQVSWALWDECTEKDLRKLRAEGVEHLQLYAEEQPARAFGRWLKRKVRPVELMVSAFGWIATEMFKGFVGGLGLVALGYLLVWAYPSTSKLLHEVVDHIAPAHEQEQSKG